MLPATPPRKSCGQALVEFALVIPLMVLIVVAVLDLGRVVWAYNSVSNAAREGARFAIVHGGSPGTACPVGPAGPEANVPFAGPSCSYPSPSTQAVKDVAREKAIATSGEVTVFVCYGAGCSGDAHSPLATNARGTPVTVRIEARLGLISTSLLCMGQASCGFGTFVVEGASTMLVNN